MRRKIIVSNIMVGFLLGCLFFLPLAKEASAETQEKELTSAYAKFGFKLFNKLISDNENKNIFVSPASIAFALAMSYNGAAAETQQAIAKTLEIQGLSLEALNQANARLLESFNVSDPKIKLRIANSLWLDQGLKFKPEFLNINEKFFGAYLKALDFTDPQAPGTINAWVAKATEGKISWIVDKIEPPLLLINSIYFKGPWTNPFKEAMTTKRPFTLLNGRRKHVLMMSQSPDYKSRYLYYRGKNFQAVSLPYGDEQKFSMKIFLPNKKSTLKEFLGELNAANWQQWLADFQPVNGAIMLPLFKLEYEVSLNVPLKALGMAMAFDDRQANFSHLCSTPPNVFIKEIKHKTFVAVDEEGTEAAGLTAIQWKRLGIDLPPKRIFKMVVDRPFFVAIDDRETGAVLFMGAIVDPPQGTGR